MYIKQAQQGKTDWWRYIATFFIVLFAKFVAELPLSMIVSGKARENGDVENIKNYMNADALDMSENAFSFTLFAPSIFFFAVIVLCMYFIHGLSFRQIFTAYKKFRWKSFFVSALIWVGLLVVAELAHYLIYPDNYAVRFAGKEFYVLLLICILFVPFQASAEELYLRGNLLQGASLLSNSRLVGIIGTALFFGLLHLGNPEVSRYGLLAAMTQYVGFGVLLGIIVAMDGGMEIAFGMHSINNIYLLSIVSYSGSVVKTPALMHSNDLNVTISTIGFVISAVLYILILKRLYKWKSFKWLISPVRGGKSDYRKEL